MQNRLVWPLLAAASVMAAPVLAADSAAPAQPSPAQQLAALCAKVPCRKAARQLELRLRDGSTFHIPTQTLPWFDNTGTLILFDGESVTLTYALDDTALAHPVLSAVSEPSGATVLSPASGPSIRFDFQQLAGKPDMQLIVTNTTAAIMKYDLVMLVPDPATGGARGGRTTACPVLPPQGKAPSFSGIENWQEPVVLLRITNIRALPAGSPMACN